jgi:hypothetical protein
MHSILCDPTVDERCPIQKCGIWKTFETEAQKMVRAELNQHVGAAARVSKRIRWHKDEVRAAEMRLPEWVEITMPTVGTVQSVSLAVLTSTNETRKTFKNIWVEATAANFEYIYGVITHQVSEGASSSMHNTENDTTVPVAIDNNVV